MYEESDIGVYILSHNRPQYILETLQSFDVQTVEGFNIRVVDNSDDARVECVVRDYAKTAKHNIDFVKNTEWAGNIYKIQDICTEPWIIAFHDDDIVHPQYIEHIIETINGDENISFLGAECVLTDSPDVCKWEFPLQRNALILTNVNDFAAFLFAGGKVPFTAAVYKKEYFDVQNVDLSMYGKMGDRPFMFSCVKSGKVAILKGVYVQSRTSALDRDSNNSSNGPFLKEYVALTKLYCSYLGINPFNKNGKIFWKAFINGCTRKLFRK